MSLRFILLMIVFFHYQDALLAQGAVGFDVPAPVHISQSQGILQAQPKVMRFALKSKFSGEEQVAAQGLALQKVLTKNRLPKDFGKHEILQERVDLKCDQDGYPTEESLQKLVQSKLLRTPTRSDIVIKSVSGGFWTEKVYSVALKHIARPVFFLKISRKDESAESIIKLQKSMIGRLGINSRYADTKLLVPANKLPIICWIEAIFWYTNSLNIPSRLEVIHAAHGVSMDSFLDGGTREAIRRGGESFGLALGLFQQVFMKYDDPNDATTWTTAAHGDLHANNSFFDEKTGRTYWIDIDTMALNQSIFIDLRMILNWAYSSYWRKKEFSRAALLKYIQSFNHQCLSAIKSFLKSKVPERFGEELGLCDVRDYGPLVAAIVASSELEVERLLRSGASPFIGSQHGHSPFEWAIKQGNFKIAKMLMQYGVDINKVSDNNPSFLSLVIEQKSIKDVEFLLALGVDINSVDSSWYQGYTRYLETPLHRAVAVGDLEIVKALLKAKNINVHALNRGGQTALFRLALRLKDDGVYTPDDIEMAKILVNAGINTAVKDGKGATVFDLVPYNMREQFNFLKPSKPKLINPQSVAQALDLLQSARREQALKIERLLSVQKDVASVVKGAAVLAVRDNNVRLVHALAPLRHAVVAR